MPSEVRRRTEFFCHECDKNVDIVKGKEGITCESCQSPFIEEKEIEVNQPERPRQRPRIRRAMIFHIPLITIQGSNGDVSPELLNSLFARGVEQPNRGLDEKNFAKVMDRKRQATEEDTCHTCPVCQESVEEEKEIIELDCKHVFCSECIEPWLKKSSNCPVCRESIE